MGSDEQSAPVMRRYLYHPEEWARDLPIENVSDVPTRVRREVYVTTRGIIKVDQGLIIIIIIRIPGWSFEENRDPISHPRPGIAVRYIGNVVWLGVAVHRRSPLNRFAIWRAFFVFWKKDGWGQWIWYRGYTRHTDDRCMCVCICRICSFDCYFYPQYCLGIRSNFNIIWGRHRERRATSANDWLLLTNSTR